SGGYDVSKQPGDDHGKQYTGLVVRLAPTLKWSLFIGDHHKPGATASGSGSAATSSSNGHHGIPKPSLPMVVLEGAGRCSDDPLMVSPRFGMVSYLCRCAEPAGREAQ